jgi:ABC-type sugar transport system ATPase subunit
MPPQTTKLQANKIVKEFPGQLALNKVDFDVRDGEIHALIGGNGAGKSTLIKVFAGVYRPDSGKIILDGREGKFANTRQAQEAGLSFIHQELNIVPHLSAAENIFLGRRKPRNCLGMVSFKRMVDAAEKAQTDMPIGADLKTPASMLSVIQQWKVVISRALASKPAVIFMDEPTASLTYDEVRELFHSMKHLRDTGTSIVYVSHRLEEVFEIADRVTVMRDGRVVGTSTVQSIDMSKLFKMMLGKEFDDVFPKMRISGDEIVLRVEGLATAKSKKPINLSVRKGEIVGIAGTVGSGRTEIIRAIFGADKKKRGEISIFGEKARVDSPKEAIRKRIALVPEERRREGLVLSMSTRNNITLASLKYSRRWLRLPILHHGKEKERARKLAEALDIRTDKFEKPVGFLSGGNQQKCVLAKCLGTRAQIFLLDEPTRGIDIGAKIGIYKVIAELAGKGAGIMIISSDVLEIIGLCHRIIVMRKGEVVGELNSFHANLETVMGLCLGGVVNVSEKPVGQSQFFDHGAGRW